MTFLDDFEKKTCLTAIQLYEADRTITSESSTDDQRVAAEEMAEALRIQMDILADGHPDWVTTLKRKLGAT